MADTTFVSGTVIASTWLNDINDAVYSGIGAGGVAPTTAAAVRTNLGYPASTGSSLLGHVSAGTGAVATTVQTKLRESVSVKDFGAVGDGVADDTAAINSAITAVSTTGGKVFFPKGTYKVTSTITITSSAGVTLEGESRTASVIKTNQATGVVISITGWDVTLQALGFDSSATRTASAYVDMVGVRGRIRDFRMTNDFIGIRMQGVSCVIQNGLLQVGASGGTRIIVTGGDTSQLIDGVTIGAQSAPFPAVGIDVLDSSALIISNTNVLTAGICLSISPSSAGVFSLFASNCFFDTSTTGIQIAPTGTGNVARCRFTGCWTGGMTANGVLMTNTGAGICEGLHFVDHHSIGNTGSGFSLNAGVKDFSVIGGEIANNAAHGVFVAANATDFSITGATIGQGAGVGQNTLWGVIVSAGTSDRYVITDNRFKSNGSGQISDGGTGTDKVISDNSGYKTSNGTTTSVTFDASGVGTISHGLALTPKWVTAFALAAASAEVTVTSVSSTTITLRLRVTTTDANQAGAYNIMWSAQA